MKKNRPSPVLGNFYSVLLPFSPPPPVLSLAPWLRVFWDKALGKQNLVNVFATFMISKLNKVLAFFSPSFLKKKKTENVAFGSLLLSD